MRRGASAEVPPPVPTADHMQRPPADASRPGHPRHNVFLIALGFAVVVLIWGSTWIGIKLTVADLPPITASGLRLLVAAPVFVIACRVLRVPMRFPRERAGLFGLILLCYFAIPFLLFYYGELYVSSGLAAMCVSSECIFMILLSVPILRARVTAGQFVAATVAFLALGALILHTQGIEVANGWGVAAVLAAAVMHAFVYVMIKRHGTAMHTLTLNTIPMTLAGTALTVAGLIAERPGIHSFTARSVGATLYLGVVGSVIGFALYFWLVQRMDTVTVSFIFVLFPVIAQFLAFLVEGIDFDWISLLLTVLVLAAVAVAQWKQRSAAITRGTGTMETGMIPVRRRARGRREPCAARWLIVVGSARRCGPGGGCRSRVMRRSARVLAATMGRMPLFVAGADVLTPT